MDETPLPSSFPEQPSPALMLRTIEKQSVEIMKRSILLRKRNNKMIGGVICEGAAAVCPRIENNTFVASRLVRNRICQRMGRGVQ